MKRLNVAISILIHSLENFDPVKVNKVYSFFFFSCACVRSFAYLHVCGNICMCAQVHMCGALILTSILFRSFKNIHIEAMFLDDLGIMIYSSQPACYMYTLCPCLKNFYYRHTTMSIWLLNGPWTWSPLIKLLATL